MGFHDALYVTTLRAASCAVPVLAPGGNSPLPAFVDYRATPGMVNLITRIVTPSIELLLLIVARTKEACLCSPLARRLFIKCPEPARPRLDAELLVIALRVPLPAIAKAASAAGRLAFGRRMTWRWAGRKRLERSERARSEFEGSECSADLGPAGSTT